MTRARPAPKLDALIVIDLQTAMFDGLVFPAMPHGEALLDRVSTLISKARACALPVIFVRHHDREGGPLARGAPGWEIAAKVAPLPHETIVEKQFADSFRDTNLDGVLRAMDAKHIAVCGAQTEYCVDTTVRSAASHGYSITLVSDAHGTFDTVVLKADQIKAHHNLTLRGFATLSTAETVSLS